MSLIVGITAVLNNIWSVLVQWWDLLIDGQSREWMTDELQ